MAKGYSRNFWICRYSQRQAGGGRGQQVGDIPGALVVGVVVNIKNKQRPNKQCQADEDRIGQRVPDPIADAEGHHIDD